MSLQFLQESLSTLQRLCCTTRALNTRLTLFGESSGTLAGRYHTYDSASSPEVRNADPEHWNLVNHNDFDGKLEDGFQSTSLHVRFTGFVLAVDVGRHGSQFREISFAEAVISVLDSGNWVADINVLESLESGSLVRIQQSR